MRSHCTGRSEGECVEVHVEHVERARAQDGYRDDASTHGINGIDIAEIKSDEILIADASTALDLIANIRYETYCDCAVFDKSIFSEEFFDLKTKIAGDVLQKFVNYSFKVAIVGDFSIYTSKSLRDFILESNKGNHIFFVSSVEQAFDKLSGC